MTKRIIVPIFLLYSLAFAEHPAMPYYQQGNRHYEAGDYLKAIAEYEKALATGYESAELYFNLGNAYFKSEQLGKSIVNYERAARLQPNDADITYNLELARLRVIDKIIVPPEMVLTKIWRSVKNIFSVNQWAIVSLILFTLTIALIIGRLLVQGSQFRFFSGIILLPILVLTIVAAGFFVLTMSEAASTQYAIIMAPKVDVLSAPAADATEVFSLHEGTKVRIGGSSGAYVRIELPDGKVGWLRQDMLEKI